MVWERRCRMPWCGNAAQHISQPACSLRGFLDQCDSKRSDTVHIQAPMGRSGNQLHQLVTAMANAVAAGRPKVDATALKGLIKHYKLADVIQLHPQPPLGCERFICEGPEGSSFKGGYDCKKSFRSWCLTDVQARRSIYLRQILPLMDNSVMATCSPAAENELVMHIRDGDVVVRPDIEHRQPPCSYYEHVMKTGFNGGPFRRLHLIHSCCKDCIGCNPCVAFLHKMFAEQIVPRAPDTLTLEHDMCLILTARNLALTASSFGITLSMMNTRLDRLFSIDTVSTVKQIQKLDPVLARKFRDYELDARELCAAFKGTKVVSYRMQSAESLVVRNCSSTLWQPPSWVLFQQSETAETISPAQNAASHSSSAAETVSISIQPPIAAATAPPAAATKTTFLEHCAPGVLPWQVGSWEPATDGPYFAAQQRLRVFRKKYEPIAEANTNPMKWLGVCDAKDSFWEWVPPKACSFPQWDSESICPLLRGRGILLVGDSLSKLMFHTLAGLFSDLREFPSATVDGQIIKVPICNSSAKLWYARNDFLSLPHHTHKGYDPRFLNAWADSSFLAAFNVLVVNTGAHVMASHSLYQQRLQEVSEFLARHVQSHPETFVTVRATVPGHAKCKETRYSPPLSGFEEANRLVQGERKWHHGAQFEKLNQIAFAEVQKHPGLLFWMDTYHSTIMRHDAHVDCLHYCLPGPATTWARTLYSMAMTVLGGRRTRTGEVENKLLQPQLSVALAENDVLEAIKQPPASTSQHQPATRGAPKGVPSIAPNVALRVTLTCPPCADDVGPQKLRCGPKYQERVCTLPGFPYCSTGGWCGNTVAHQSAPPKYWYQQIPAGCCGKGGTQPEKRPHSQYLQST